MLTIESLTGLSALLPRLTGTFCARHEYFYEHVRPVILSTASNATRSKGYSIGHSARDLRTQGWRHTSYCGATRRSPMRRWCRRGAHSAGPSRTPYACAVRVATAASAAKAAARTPAALASVAQRRRYSHSGPVSGVCAAHCTGLRLEADRLRRAGSRGGVAVGDRLCKAQLWAHAIAPKGLNTQVAVEGLPVDADCCSGHQRVATTGASMPEDQSRLRSTYRPRFIEKGIFSSTGIACAILL